MPLNNNIVNAIKNNFYKVNAMKLIFIKLNATKSYFFYGLLFSLFIFVIYNLCIILAGKMVFFGGNSIA